MENRFNLIDEPWIPIANEGLKSLGEVFSGEGTALGGTAREKIALMKLLLAIAQSAWTPENRKDWLQKGPAGMGKICMDYLKTQRDKFFLYGEKPFLQMPVQKAEKKSYGVFLPQVASGNTTRLTEFQMDLPLDDAERALLLITEMSMCLGGKKPDKNCLLDPEVEKKTAPPGPGMCSRGLQHSFLLGNTVLESIWLNLADKEFLKELGNSQAKIGTPPWEDMPKSETCQRANELKNTYIGRLVPMARFCLLADDGLHSTEGIRHPDYLSDVVDVSAAGYKDKANKYKMLWIDPEKRPWRSLPAILGFLDAKNADRKFQSVGLKRGITRLTQSYKKSDFLTNAHIWCGGFKVSNTSGEQFASGSDDSVESDFTVGLANMKDEWYSLFAEEMDKLEKYANHLYACVNSYLSKQKLSDGRAKMASGMYWDKAEEYFQDILNNSGNKEKIEEINKIMKNAVLNIYNSLCPQNTPRQLELWAECKPFRKKSDQTGYEKEDVNAGTRN